MVIGGDPSVKKRVNYLNCIEVKGDGKDIHWSAQNAALFVDLLQNIFSNDNNRDHENCNFALFLPRAPYSKNLIVKLNWGISWSTIRTILKIWGFIIWMVS